MRRILAFVVSLALVTTVTDALAQAPADAERTAAARALFEEGMHAVDEGDWATAADRLRRSQELRPSPVVRYNLALALSELGHIVEASEHLRALVRESPQGSDVNRLASERLEAILPRLGRLRIDVSGPRSTVEVRLDGDVVPDALVGVPQPADPGAHRVTLQRGEDEVAAHEVTVTSGALATVALEAPAAVAPRPEDVARAGVQPGPDDPAVPVTDTGGVEGEWWFWTLIGAVVVVGAAVAIGAWAATSAQPPPYVVGDSGSVHPTLVEFP